MKSALSLEKMSFWSQWASWTNRCQQHNQPRIVPKNMLRVHVPAIRIQYKARQYSYRWYSRVHYKGCRPCCRPGFQSKWYRWMRFACILHGCGNSRKREKVDMLHVCLCIFLGLVIVFSRFSCFLRALWKWRFLIDLHAFDTAFEMLANRKPGLTVNATSETAEEKTCCMLFSIFSLVFDSSSWNGIFRCDLHAVCTALETLADKQDKGVDATSETPQRIHVCRYFVFCCGFFLFFSGSFFDVFWLFFGLWWWWWLVGWLHLWILVSVCAPPSLAVGSAHTHCIAIVHVHFILLRFVGLGCHCQPKEVRQLLAQVCPLPLSWQCSLCWLWFARRHCCSSKASQGHHLAAPFTRQLF